MRATRLLLGFCLCFCGTMSWAQLSNVLVIDRDRLYAESVFGQTLRGSRKEELQALEDENQRIFEELREEELELTETRPTYSAEEFEVLARAFDEKVQDIRRARQELADKADKDIASLRDLFFERIQPVIAQIMVERKAAVILDRTLAVWSFDQADITDLAIQRIDKTFVPR